jgi:serine protease
MIPTRFSSLLIACALAAALGAAGSASASVTAPPEPGDDYVEGELLVRFAEGEERLVELPAGVPVAEAAESLAANGRVEYALPNYIARAAATGPSYVPNDPGAGSTPGDWRALQWNFLPCGSGCEPPVLDATGKPVPPAPLPFEARGGIDAPRAWAALRARGRAGAEGIKIAVLDTGIAFRSMKPRFAKSPDFSPRQFASGSDFVAGDRFPLDQDGHGTHIAGTIAEQTGNGRALTGLAYGAKLIPVRVLNAAGEGEASDIAKGIRFASAHGARIINMSFEFGGAVTSCKQIRGICSAVRAATARGSLVVAATGNGGLDTVSFPARIPGVLGVGATTEGGCAAEYSNRGPGLDIVAPGGRGESVGRCATSDRPIVQLTLLGPSFKSFGFPTAYMGTSMASAHATGVAALVMASGVIGPRPKPPRIECQLAATARKTNLGEPYDAAFFGAGLLDAGRATTETAC